MSNTIYDVIIIGGGPAGLTAALYNARARLKVLVLEKSKLGGQITITHEIANFPGAVYGEGDEPSGPELMDRMVEQAQKFGAEIKVGEDVCDLEVDGKVKKLTCKNGNVYEAKAIICANGASPRHIGCPGEVELTGKGVSYCATCDGAFFEDMEVYVVGGGNSAVEEATMLAGIARKVTLIQNLSTLTADAIAIENIHKQDNVEYIFDSVVQEIRGDGIVEEMDIKNTKTGEVTTFTADEEDGTFGVFIFIGYVPSTDIYKGKVPLNDWGYIESDADMKTSIPGVFAAGDIRPKSLRQVITACGDGAIAAHSAQRYVEHYEA